MLWWLVVTSLTVCTHGVDKDKSEEPEEMSVMDESQSDIPKSLDTFVPTKEWQVVKDGQHIPPGLHVRMDFQTGVKEAKLLEEEGEEEEEEEKERSVKPSDNSGKTHPYGESDRRGVVNKRTKVFSAEEVTNMLKDVNNETVDLSNLPRLASAPSAPQGTSSSGEGDSRLRKEEKEGQETKPTRSTASKDLPVTFHRDVEQMLELSIVLANNLSSVPDLCQALEELEYYVHQIHNAHDLNGIGGLVLVVRLLNHTHPDVKSWAARVIGSASQRYSIDSDIVM